MRGRGGGLDRGTAWPALRALGGCKCSGQSIDLPVDHEMRTRLDAPDRAVSDAVRDVG
jgi:hypothetical protein